MIRGIGFVVLGAVLVALGLLVMLGHGCSIHWDSGMLRHLGDGGPVVVDGVELPFKRTIHCVAAKAPARLDVEFDAASVDVTGVREATEATADYEVCEKTQGDAVLEWGASGPVVSSKGGSPVYVASANIHVPASTSVAVKTDLGSIRVSGIGGADSVTAKAASGRVSLSGLHDLARAEAESDLGEVSIDGAERVAQITVSADTGKVWARAIKGATSVSVTTDLGDAEVEAVEASESVTAKADTGSVSAVDVRTKAGRLTTDLGSVTAKRCKFDHLEASADTGSVRLVGVTYRTKDVKTSLGSATEEK